MLEKISEQSKNIKEESKKLKVQSNKINDLTKANEELNKENSKIKLDALNQKQDSDKRFEELAAMVDMINKLNEMSANPTGMGHNQYDIVLNMTYWL